MGWRTRTSALPIRDLRQIAYLLPMWGGIGSGVVFLWRRLICLQNSSLRMFWYRDLNSSHFFHVFGALGHEANRSPDISATSIGSRKKFCKLKRMSVCPARKGKPNILSVSYRAESFQSVQQMKNYAPSEFCAKICSTPGMFRCVFYNAILRKKQSFWVACSVKNPPHGLTYIYTIVLFNQR